MKRIIWCCILAFVTMGTVFAESSTASPSLMDKARELLEPLNFMSPAPVEVNIDPTYVSKPWIVGEAQKDGSILYYRHDDNNKYPYSCSITISADGLHMKIVAVDERWHGLEIIQTMTFDRQADGSLVLSEKRLSEDIGGGGYVPSSQRKKKNRAHDKKKHEQGARVGMQLPILAYDIFTSCCIKDVGSLSGSALSIFSELYRPSDPDFVNK